MFYVFGLSIYSGPRSIPSGSINASRQAIVVLWSSSPPTSGSRGIELCIFATPCDGSTRSLVYGCASKSAELTLSGLKHGQVSSGE